MIDVVGVSFDLTPMDPGLLQPNLHVSGSTLYISYTDLLYGSSVALVTAAQIGPAALGVALTALASLVGGPVGTVIGCNTRADSSAITCRTGWKDSFCCSNRARDLF